MITVKLVLFRFFRYRKPNNRPDVLGPGLRKMVKLNSEIRQILSKVFLSKHMQLELRAINSVTITVIRR